MSIACKKIIIIDDDSTNNLIFKITIKNLCKPVTPNIVAFTNPEEGLAYLIDSCTCYSDAIVLFLDINMPVLNGWDVLNKLSLLPEHNKQLLTVFMFSSSSDPADKEKSRTYHIVKEYIEKPVSLAMSWLRQELLEDVLVTA